MTQEDLPGLMLTMRGLWASYGGWPWEPEIWQVWLEELTPYTPANVAAAVRQIARNDASDFPPGVGRVRAICEATARQRRTEDFLLREQCDRIIDAHVNGHGLPTPASPVPTDAEAERAQWHIDQLDAGVSALDLRVKR